MTIFRQCEPVLGRLLVECDEALSIFGLLVEELLSCHYKVGIACDGGAIGDEVGDRLHDVPGVLPPGEPCQDSELDRHQAKSNPGDR